MCFNTAITGYQEILTDPSYAGQIVTFTFPHIGNVGRQRRGHGDARSGSRRAGRGCDLPPADHAALQLSRTARPR